ncbi:MAG: redoxin domain-containing protein [Phycisphaeraceae bacterium]|nr:redoxin domain-containing protein [Phycisphaeraceae bacterium]
MNRLLSFWRGAVGQRCGWWGSVAGVLLGVALIVRFSWPSGSSLAQVRLDPDPRPAPEFPAGLDWLNTPRPLSLTELRGKVVLLDFWTFCCVNCLHVIPELRELEERYPKELAVIGVHSAKFTNEKDSRKIQQAIERYGVTHPVVNDKDFKIWSLYGVRAWPTFVLIDPQGRIAAVHAGEGVRAALEGPIAQLIARYDLPVNGPQVVSPETSASRPPSAQAEAKESALLAFPGKIMAGKEPGGQTRLYIADSSHHRILAADPKTGQVLEVIGSGQPGLVDGDFARACFTRPQGLALEGQYLFVADTENHAIRRVDLARRVVETFVGTGVQSADPSQGGVGRNVALSSPWDLLAAKGKLYVAMAGSHQLWQVNLVTLEAAPWVGSGVEGLQDGAASMAELAQPSGLATDGERIFFLDSEASALRLVNLAGGQEVTTLVGHGLFEFGDRDGAGGEALLQHPLGVLYRDGAVWVADTYNHKIKRFDLATGRMTTELGTGQAGMADGSPQEAQFNEPSGLAYAGGCVYIADTNNHAIRVYDLKFQEVRTLTLRIGLPAETLPASGPAP